MSFLSLFGLSACALAMFSCAYGGPPIAPSEDYVDEYKWLEEDPPTEENEETEENETATE